MSASDSPNAIRKTVVVRCGVDAAFRAWTEQINVWWPKGHSRSGVPNTTVCLETRLGGRIFERTPEGVEHDWGEVTVWDPPRHFTYHWYLGSSPNQPTMVQVRFTAHTQGSTLVAVLHQGPELIGEHWSRNSHIFARAWEALLPAYAAVCESLNEALEEEDIK